MTLFIKAKVLNWFVQRKKDINDKVDAYWGGLIFQTNVTDEDYEKTHWGDLFEKIAAEPNNPYHYYQRGNRRIGVKWRNYRRGVIADFTEVIRIVSADKDKYPDIELDFCYYSICKNASILGDFAMEKTDFSEADKCYALSISSGQGFLECPDRRGIYNDECNDYMKKSVQQLLIAQSLLTK
jgi:hypothetical protein